MCTTLLVDEASTLSPMSLTDLEGLFTRSEPMAVHFVDHCLGRVVHLAFETRAE